jgi:hypothetical protein
MENGDSRTRSVGCAGGHHERDRMSDRQYDCSDMPGNNNHVRPRKRFNRDAAICASSFARIKSRQEDSQWWYDRYLQIEVMLAMHDEMVGEASAATTESKESN